ncbi:hypothetical protein [Pantoea sp. UBA5035]|uniref:hypothetical protein n=1 Tax=Pantoea sp. UBA5035 TaxID=1947035 RepID=UPI00257F8A10|nr:hypothetical protein [Pantoea sp. UBA5035]
MISDERIEYIATTGNARGKDSQEMAKELLAHRKAREGWKLVPVEPTKEMWDAYDDAPDDIDSEWAAMLAAAPEPE